MTREMFHRLLPGWMTIRPLRGRGDPATGAADAGSPALGASGSPAMAWPSPIACGAAFGGSCAGAGEGSGVGAAADGLGAISVNWVTGGATSALLVGAGAPDSLPGGAAAG